MIDILLNWLKYHKIVKNGIIWQTSYLSKYISDYITVDKHIMKKLITSIFDYRDSYFWLFVAKDYIFYNKLLELNLQEKMIKTEWNLQLLDVDKVIKVKGLAKDLFLLEIDEGQTILARKKDNSDANEIIESYVINKWKNFYELDLSLLEDYKLEDLRQVFGVIDNSLMLFKQLVGEKNEKQKLKKEFTFTTVAELERAFRFNCLYLGEDYCLNKEERKFKSYYLSLGSAGSGKTFTLLHSLFNIFFSREWSRIIFFDTQKTFNLYYSKLREKYRELFRKLVEKYDIKVLVVNEKSIFLSETDLINAINYILEAKGLVSREEKQKTLMGIRLGEVKSVEDLKLKLTRLISYWEKKKDYKEMWRLELAKELLEIVKSITVKDLSFFDYLTKNYLIVLQFDNVLYYDMLSFLFFEKLYKELREREEKETWLFLDETQKYLQSEIIQQLLGRLMREKRQFGLRVMFTGLTYQDIKDLFKLTQVIVMNDISDTYVYNSYVVNKLGQLDIEKHREKIIIEKDSGTVKKTEFLNYLFD